MYTNCAQFCLGVATGTLYVDVRAILQEYCRIVTTGTLHVNVRAIFPKYCWIVVTGTLHFDVRAILPKYCRIVGTGTLQVDVRAILPKYCRIVGTGTLQWQRVRNIAAILQERCHSNIARQYCSIVPAITQYCSNVPAIFLQQSVLYGNIQNVEARSLWTVAKIGGDNSATIKGAIIRRALLRCNEFVNSLNMVALVFK